MAGVCWCARAPTCVCVCVFIKIIVLCETYLTVITHYTQMKIEYKCLY